MFGVKSIAQLKTIDSKLAVTGLFKQMWAQFPKETKVWWSSSKISVIGSVKEADTFHVVLRTTVNLSGEPMSVVSVATAMRSTDGWKLLSSAEFQGMVQKLSQ